MDGSAPIRGGVPVCFPQFNQRSPALKLPKHGFARALPWTFLAEQPHPSFELKSNDFTKTLWAFDFVTRLSFELETTDAANHLTVRWSVENSGDEPFAFTGALHTYLKIESLETASLIGLQGQSEWDALQDPSLQKPQTVGPESIRFSAEFDRVYTAVPSSQVLTLASLERTLNITQSDSLAHTVVWNPHRQLCAALADMPDDGYQSMLCVEAAQVFNPISVAPGQTWQGWQQFSLAQVTAG
jgi:glucose-6-phosphate 1-epimerase